MELAEKLERALGALESQDIADRVKAVEELAVCSSAIAGRVATQFETDEEARYLIFERMGRFGSLMVGHIEQTYREADDPDLVLQSAAALLYMGSQVGVPSLMAAIEVGNPHMCTAARALADAGIHQAAGLIEDALLVCDLSADTVLGCLTDALRRLGHQMREDVRIRLSSVEPEWRRRSLIG